MTIVPEHLKTHYYNKNQFLGIPDRVLWESLEKKSIIKGFDGRLAIRHSSIPHSYILVTENDDFNHINLCHYNVKEIHRFKNHRHQLRLLEDVYDKEMVSTRKLKFFVNKKEIAPYTMHFQFEIKHLYFLNHQKQLISLMDHELTEETLQKHIIPNANMLRGYTCEKLKSYTSFFTL